ncbi:hypothetical protein OHV08_34410 [Streptomyces canus]|uniref:hypothetical protein n=1 Tax=Streptomyces canus TaxID=58343 RepID=UPI00325657F6
MPEPDPELALISALAATARAVEDGTLTGDTRDQTFKILGSAKDRYLDERPLPMGGFDDETADAVGRALAHGYVDPVDHDW